MNHSSKEESSKTILTNSDPKNQKNSLPSSPKEDQKFLGRKTFNVYSTNTVPENKNNKLIECENCQQKKNLSSFYLCKNCGKYYCFSCVKLSYNDIDYIVGLKKKDFNCHKCYKNLLKNENEDSLSVTKSCFFCGEKSIKFSMIEIGKYSKEQIDKILKVEPGLDKIIKGGGVNSNNNDNVNNKDNNNNINNITSEDINTTNKDDANEDNTIIYICENCEKKKNEIISLINQCNEEIEIDKIKKGNIFDLIEESYNKSKLGMNLKNSKIKFHSNNNSINTNIVNSNIESNLPDEKEQGIKTESINKSLNSREQSSLSNSQNSKKYKINNDFGCIRGDKDNMISNLNINPNIINHSELNQDILNNNNIFNNNNNNNILDIYRKTLLKLESGINYIISKYNWINNININNNINTNINNNDLIKENNIYKNGLIELYNNIKSIKDNILIKGTQIENNNIFLPQSTNILNNLQNDKKYEQLIINNLLRKNLYNQNNMYNMLPYLRMQNMGINSSFSDILPLLRDDINNNSIFNLLNNNNNPLSDINLALDNILNLNNNMRNNQLGLDNYLKLIEQNNPLINTVNPNNMNLLNPLMPNLNLNNNINDSVNTNLNNLINSNKSNNQYNGNINSLNSNPLFFTNIPTNIYESNNNNSSNVNSNNINHYMVSSLNESKNNSSI